MYTKVIIVGGGFGGLNAAKMFKKVKTDLLLIDKTNHHLFQPLLYQVATAGLSTREIAIPLREILRNQENTSVIMGEVVAIDKEKKLTILRNGDEIAFDYLILAPGAKHSYFGKNEWELLAPGLKTITDALKIREDVLISFEIAERMDRISEAEKYLNFVLIGGGPTGVEMAGAIAEIAQKTMFKNFRRIKPEKSQIYLIEALSNILPAYPQKLAIKAAQYLKDMGVKVITGKRVTQITDDGVQMEDLFIPSKNVIWAAGNEASPLLKTLHVPLDRQGRVIVEPDLSIPHHPDIFVIGDGANLPGKEGKPLPGIAPVAIQMGKYAAKIIIEETAKENRKPFKYFDKGNMAAIGTKKAIAVVGKLHFSGFIAWASWCFIHIVYLIGFRNRFRVMIEWFYSFITGQRGARLIYHPIEGRFPKRKKSD
ncbi:MAG: NAD(P)/FAD-dependent oxidoreductase [Chlamydiae bacterium]|nr:NAD(P)/FAD-dependent oxidoreductase [Chlamydiota bacterium]